MSKSKLDKLSKIFKVTLPFIFGFLTLILATNVKAQGWDTSFGDTRDDWGQSILQTEDLGFVIAGYSRSFNTDQIHDFNAYIIKTDVDGKKIWEYVYEREYRQFAYKIIETEDKGFLVVGDTDEEIDFDTKPNVFLLKIDKKGVEQWTKVFGNSTFEERGYSIVEAKDGEGYLIVGITNETTDANTDILLIRIDDEGEEVWRNTVEISGDGIGETVVALDDGFAVAGIADNPNTNKNDAILIRLNSFGEQVWTRRLGDGTESKEVKGLILTHDNHLVFVGSSNNSLRSLMAKYDLDGEQIWLTIGDFTLDTNFKEIVELKDSSLVAVGHRNTSPEISLVLLSKFTKDGDFIWENLVEWNRVPEGNLKLQFAEDFTTTADGGFAITGVNTQDGILFNDVILLKTNNQGNLISNHIFGKVYYSADGCNPYNDEDLALPNWIIKAESETNTYYGTTDAEGNYDIRVDSGYYTVSLLAQNDYWSICNNEFTIDFTEFYDTTIFNFPVEAALLCPYLAVEISADRVVICEDVTYTVAYNNYGPITVNDPYIDVQLDDEVTFISSDLSETNLGNNLFRFEIGDVLPTAGSSFEILGTVACEGIEDAQAIIASAHVFPDTLCSIPGPEWDGASIYVRGECEDGNVTFFVGNRADAENMQSPKASFIVEDQILFLVEPYELDAGEEIEIAPIDGSGATYRIIAEQVDGHPGQNNPTIAIEGCVEDGENYSTGITTQFPENDRDYYISFDIQEVVSSSIPVILRGYPKGYDNSIISPTTDLEYTIAFQNTGTDTINRLVIRDTLPAFLDRTKIRLGASSHPYEFEIYNSGVVKFTIEDIELLPGSSTQPELSRGYVSFTVPQIADNPMGTIIKNSAAIFFDYQEPVQTNEVIHIVDCMNFLDTSESCITVDFWTPILPELTIKVYPNPFEEAVTIELEKFEGQTLTFTLFDVTGKEVRAQSFTGNNYVFYRKQLPAGLYIFKLQTEGKLIGSGKIMMR